MFSPSIGSGPISVLLIEDNPGDARLIHELLTDGGASQFIVDHADRLSTGLERVARGTVDAVLLDLSLPDSQGLETLIRANPQTSGVPILVLTGLDDEKMGLEAMQCGAQDYLVKGRLDDHSLVRSIRYAIERKRLEEQKADFLTLASHELKTPIAIIRASTQIALRAVQRLSDEKLNHTLSVVNEQTERMARLINDLLDVSSVQGGSIRLHIEKFDLGDLIRKVVSSLELTMPGFTFTLDLPAGQLLVEADIQRIEQVIANLLHNAVKYSDGDHRIEITLTQSDDSALVSVRDFGMGIPLDQQPQVFKRFFRGRNVDASHHGGLGLGLFITQGIVAAHGGEMWLKSIERKGSTFYFSLPIAWT